MMKMKNIKHLFIACVAFATLFTFNSCVEDKFDTPPAGGTDPNLTANITIADLKAAYTGTPIQITNDYIIIGTVNADDRNGNFYQSLTIQDSTGGILIRIEMSDYNTKYPKGRRVFVKCKNLWMGDYNGLIQMGGSLDGTSVETIAEPLIEEYIFEGVYGLTVTPKLVTIPMLNDSYQNVLIQLNSVEFDDGDMGQPFADVVNLSSVNRTIVDCNDEEILLRTSGFATFAGEATPKGNGYIQAVYAVFGSDKQLQLNDLSELTMDTLRCDGSGGPAVLVDISSVRAMFSGSTTNVQGSKKIIGTVISDYVNGNTTSRNMVIQDGTAGITVRFDADHSIPLGAQVEVEISGQELSEFAGLLQINNVPLSFATQNGTGSVTPNILTILAYLSDAENLESTLVQFNNVTITGTGTYSGSQVISDGTGSMTFYTRSGASFASTAYPAGSVNIKGFTSEFNGDPQISIRTLADVQ